mmetsp:Transcript_14819/g.42700  ORF Transcript_14819/g.42700 Transcript_14819/m.42700 type:complete len:232 (+) Transcript_14819:298-993(+)
MGSALQRSVGGRDINRRRHANTAANRGGGNDPPRLGFGTQAGQPPRSPHLRHPSQHHPYDPPHQTNQAARHRPDPRRAVRSVRSDQRPLGGGMPPAPAHRRNQDDVHSRPSRVVAGTDGHRHVRMARRFDDTGSHPAADYAPPQSDRAWGEGGGSQRSVEVVPIRRGADVPAAYRWKLAGIGTGRHDRQVYVGCLRWGSTESIYLFDLSQRWIRGRGDDLLSAGGGWYRWL